MSQVLFDFLTESMFFSDHHIDNEFRLVSDRDLRLALEDYRQHATNVRAALFSETVAGGTSRLAAFSEATRDSLPTPVLLKQTALYLKTYIIADPLFPFTRTKTEIEKSFAEFNGFVGDKLDRQGIASAVSYMRAVTPLVAGGYVKFIPTADLERSVDGIPINFSTNYFSDVLPKPLLEWLRQRAVVSPMKKTERGLLVLESKDLKPCRHILIRFDGDGGAHELSRCYQLVEQKTIDFNEETRIARFVQILPDDPPEQELFNAWVSQSINQTAASLVKTVNRGIGFAANLNSMYCTDSSLVADLLQQTIGGKTDVPAHTLQSLLRLKIPAVDSVSFEQIMDARRNEGAAFEDFRSHLESKLIGLRGITDPEELSRKIEEAEHEIVEVDLKKIERSWKALRRKVAFADAPSVFCALGLAVTANPLSYLAVGSALAMGFGSYSEYRSKITENPAFFLWKALR